MTPTVEADYLVVGAGATGMAFADAVTAHAGARVVMVDRRHGVGGHWWEAYPFVRLHQASVFYGVASTVLGGEIQRHGPEQGLHERASQAEICDYYGRVLERLVESGRVEFHPHSEYLGHRTVVSRLSGKRFEVSARCRIVDARYLAPGIPAETPPPFEVEQGARVLPVNDLARLDEAPARYVVVGSGKTATDACVWLLTHGVDADAICWVRPRDPWMLNRAVVQPDPAVFLGMAADVLEAASRAADLHALFAELEDVGVMLRLDRSVTPTMAKAPTLGRWELDLLRGIEDVVQRGRLVGVGPGRLRFGDGTVSVPDDALVVHCAGDGLRTRPLVPVWGPEAITLQPIRAGFPCFGAALVGYVEATREDDQVKNRLCPPSPYGDTLAGWARMTLLGTRNARSFSAEPDIADWSNRVALNPARIPADHRGSAAVDGALERLAAVTPAALARLAALV